MATRIERLIAVGRDALEAIRAADELRKGKNGANVAKLADILEREARDVVAAALKRRRRRKRTTGGKFTR